MVFEVHFMALLSHKIAKSLKNCQFRAYFKLSGISGEFYLVCVYFARYF